MRGGHGLWLAATAGSIGLHGVIGITLYAMPMPEVRKAPPTEIRFETPDVGTAAPLSPAPQTPSLIPSVSPTALPASTQAERAARPEAVLRPVESQTDVAPMPGSLTAQPPAPQALQPAPIERQEAPGTALEAIQPAPPQTAEASERPEALTATEFAGVGVTDRTIPVPAAGNAPDTTMAEPSAPQRLEPAPQEVMVVASPAAEPALPVAPMDFPAPGSIVPPAKITSLPQVAPSSAVQQALADPSVDVAPAAAAPRSTAAPVAPAAPRAVGVPTVVAASPVKPDAAMAPAAVAPGPVPVGEAKSAMMPRNAAPVSKGTAVAVAPAVAPAAPVVVGAVPIEGRSAGTDGEEQLAMVMRPSAAGDGSGPATKGGRLRVGDFLAARDGDECLLALPVSMGAQEASIEAFAIKPEAVARLGSAYEKESGLSLKTDTRAVSESQCSALTFARGLAAYPNFPLRLTLNEARIRSGTVLSGVISGLRKPTLYLIVVDDEGKAELMDANLDVRSTITSFRAPMTLTSGPVSSVQLLVAIAADGPLETVPRRPGMPAEEYFSRLATEIVMGNRSIAYGITSFEVQ